MGCSTAAFADDFSLVICADTKEELMYRAEEASETVIHWIESQSLEIRDKTEAIILRGSPWKKKGKI